MCLNCLGAGEAFCSGGGRTKGTDSEDVVVAPRLGLRHNQHALRKKRESRDAGTRLCMQLPRKAVRIRKLIVLYVFREDLIKVWQSSYPLPVNFLNA